MPGPGLEPGRRILHHPLKMACLPIPPPARRDYDTKNVPLLRRTLASRSVDHGNRLDGKSAKAPAGYGSE